VGIAWAEIDGCRTLEAYRSELERAPANLLQACRAFLPDFSGLTPDEAQSVAEVIALADVLRLAPPTRVPLPPGDDPPTCEDARVNAVPA
jgi:hypothetical protein